MTTGNKRKARKSMAGPSVGPKPEKELYIAIRDLILSARKTVSRGIDSVQVRTNFEIGRHIFEQEQKGRTRASYGQEILNSLADTLTAEFGKGFSLTNLKLMRQFYHQYRYRIGQSATDQSAPKQKGQSPTDQLPGNLELPQPRFTLSWTHYVALLSIPNPEERDFYEIEAASQNWAVKELKRQFESSLYERLALSRDKKGIRALSKKGQVVEKPADLMKEPLVLEFLGLDEASRYSESELETAIINRIEHFLLELGKGFLFEARQKRFTFDDDHFFVDLVFYNRLLRCYVVIDLKIGKITHQDLGQIQMYVNYFDRHVKTEGENPTIGILLCKQKSQALVEITLPKGANVHAREYSLYLPGKEELKRKLMEWVDE